MYRLLVRRTWASQLCSTGHTSSNVSPPRRTELERSSLTLWQHAVLQSCAPQTSSKAKVQRARAQLSPTVGKRTPGEGEIVPSSNARAWAAWHESKTQRPSDSSLRHGPTPATPPQMGHGLSPTWLPPTQACCSSSRASLGRVHPVDSTHGMQCSEVN